MIYFIQQGYSGAIKIGYTDSDAQQRLSQLQVGNPNHLLLVATMPGNIDDEGRLHLLFQKFRINGEWFKNTETLQTYIRENAQYSSEYVTYIRHYLNKSVNNCRKQKKRIGILERRAKELSLLAASWYEVADEDELYLQCCIRENLVDDENNKGFVPNSSLGNVQVVEINNNSIEKNYIIPATEKYSMRDSFWSNRFSITWPPEKIKEFYNYDFEFKIEYPSEIGSWNIIPGEDCGIFFAYRGDKESCILLVLGGYEDIDRFPEILREKLVGCGYEVDF